MAFALHYSDNWNGILCNDAFPFIRPISQHLYVGADVEVMIKDYFLGYAQVTTIRQVALQDVNDLMAWCIMGNNGAYLRTVLRRMNGNALDSTPFAFGTATYTQRNESTVAELYERRWKQLKEKSKWLPRAALKEGLATMQPDFTTTQSHWNGEETYRQ